VLLNYFTLGRFHTYIINVYIVRNLYILIIQNMHLFIWNLMNYKQHENYSSLVTEIS